MLEGLQQLPASVLVNGVFMAQMVVQVIDHRRVTGRFQQQVGETAHAVGTELVHLEQDLPARREAGFGTRGPGNSCLAPDDTCIRLRWSTGTATIVTGRLYRQALS